MTEPLTDPQAATPTEPDLILDLDQIDADLLPLVGGKAANLGVLTRAGFPVPGGFCLTTSAYRRAVAELGLDEIVTALTTAMPAELPDLAARARKLVAAAPVPPEVTAGIRAAYTRLGSDIPVAVRSSATAEDLPFASFAGQQDTFLNVVGPDEVEQAIRRCWASLWTDRAVSYRQANGIDHAAVAIAVVVQRMVEPDVAGVMFTANPLTGTRDEAMIDASPGLGEAVVSGAANPDHFVVAGTGRIRERRIGDKRVSIRSTPGGGTQRVDEQQATEASLDDDQVRALAALGRRVERHYGAPQDTEWAIDADGTLWLTQARPITTLYPAPQRSEPAPGARIFLCFTLAQGLTRPITPMGLAAFRLIGASVAAAAGFPVANPLNGPPPYAEAGQRFFIDVTPAVRSAVGRGILPRVFDVMEARSATVLRGLFDDPRFSVVERRKRKLIEHVARVAIPAGAPLVALRALIAPAAALRGAGRATARVRRMVAIPDDATALQRLEEVKRILGRELFPIVPSIIPLPLIGFALLALAHKLAAVDEAPGQQASPQQAAWQSVLRGLPNNVTTEMDLDLWALAARIRADAASVAAFTGASVADLVARYRAGSLPAALQTGLAGFLARHGIRAVAEIDVGIPRWSEDPTHIIGVLANYLRLTESDAAPDRQFAAAQREARRATATLVRAARRRSRLRGVVVSAALRRTRAFAGLRELPKHLLVTALSTVRSELLTVGAELAAAGRIDQPDDVFFLDLTEAEQGLRGADQRGSDLRDRVAERRLAYEQELRRRHIPRVLLSDGTEPEAAASAPAAEGALTGSPASAGSVTGPARVILDPVGAHLEPGDILVAPSTDPGWTPLFLTAGGLVMEMGGANSHGAVVAREYGIPAVVGVPDATTRLSTGQSITVDGSAGTVTPA
ncbi:PEP/pyruvate-binding domain-containing protein [Salinibacterium sp. ZJ454]|uniref:PEP/pyruvate-binding domain-containing protein n=1 Tax=Salinibacterium sp. ZJ454 TaxID=2708339 RepID=UPI0014233AA7|nr:PEP/pyruvate-binding domain-containing protein [Salinibacterium sp. ZJ454]